MCCTRIALWLASHMNKILTFVFVAEAVPKRILDIMNVDNLTRENVASHLQVCANGSIARITILPKSLLWRQLCFHCDTSVLACWPVMTHVRHVET